MLDSFLSGAIVLASAVIAMLFWRYRRRTGDRLFGLFAVAFVLLGVERVAIEFLSNNPRSLIYLIRLLAFLLLLYAVLDKNRKERQQ